MTLSRLYDKAETRIQLCLKYKIYKVVTLSLEVHVLQMNLVWLGLWLKHPDYLALVNGHFYSSFSHPLPIPTVSGLNLCSPKDIPT